MSDRKYCKDCDHYVGGGVCHDKSCEMRGSIIVNEGLHYDCQECNSEVGIFQEDIKLSRRPNAKYHDEDCDMRGEIEDRLTMEKED